ncbi:MAG: DHH family phosphoesterase [bacterium]|nr:DHH family phosphoesterase [bacterium]
MTIPETTLVIGHRNPDMDAIASAVGYAWYLNQVGSGFIAARTGQVNTQTDFALKRFNMDAPPIVTDVRARVGDVAEMMPALHAGQTILDACQSIARTRRAAAILDDQQKPLGLLSGSGLFANLVDALSSASVLALAKEFDREAETAVDDGTVMLKAEDFIQDVTPQVLRADQDDFIVIDAQGAYVGLCRKSSLLSPPRRKVVMVDHNELAQSVPGLEEAEVSEVLDHHRLNTVPTSVPIRFSIDTVGSCSTLVTENALERNLVFPAGIAGLLLCGILSDTLIFRSPTVTQRDQAAAFQLGKMAGLYPASAKQDEIDTAINELGQSLLAAGAGLGTRPASEILNTDIKYYDVGGLNAGIAQVEVTNFREIAEREQDLCDALTQMMESQKLALALLMITDVVRGNSRLMAVGLPRVIGALPYPRLSDNQLDAPGVMSRKKQLLPVVLAALSQSV